ncbi:hypothetical protein HDU98_012120 [Podochytrium sp. JEL0797]|nr:hypothetical protein HDU98_012120 [Podochytrium sp. JEL0797]
MGISGLLPLLAPIHKQTHLKDLAGLTVAVDTYVWLHRGAFGCAMDLGLNQPTTAYIRFCMNRVALLKQHKIKPVLVFDGGCLPMKHHTESERRKRRKEAREMAHKELAMGNRGKAMEMFQRCVDITPNMAWELMKVLRKENIDFIVAPYEADAQLVYLEKIRKVDAILTEDSDLLVFGCQRLLVKLEASGNVVEIEAKNFPHVPCMKRGWSFEKFRKACILSGCDYLPSLKGVGIKKAFEAMNGASSAERLLDQWKKYGHVIKAPPWRENYELEFQEAEWTFQYQRVYDPTKKQLVHLNTPSEDLVGQMDEMSRFLGRNLEPAIAEGVATGILNPYSLKPYSKDEEFIYDDENAVPLPPRARPPKPLPQLRPNPPIDLSKASRILQTSTSSTHIQRQTISTSVSSHFFSSPIPEPDLEPSSTPPDEAAGLALSQPEPEWFDSTPPPTQPIQFSSSRFAQFQNTTVSVSDGFSYHQSCVKLSASRAVGGGGSTNDDKESVKNPDVPSSNENIPFERDNANAGSRSGVDEVENAAKADVPLNPPSLISSLADDAPSKLPLNVQYMEWDQQYKPPVHSHRTQHVVAKAVGNGIFGNRLGQFRSFSGEQTMYSSVAANKPTTGTQSKPPVAATRGGSGGKKRLGTGRPQPSAIHPFFKPFFGTKK